MKNSIKTVMCLVLLGFVMMFLAWSGVAGEGHTKVLMLVFSGVSVMTAGVLMARHALLSPRSRERWVAYSLLAMIMGSAGVAYAQAYAVVIVPQVFTATASIDFGATAANVCDESSAITIYGASTDDVCIASSPSDLAANSISTCYVSATNTVKVRRCNVSVAALSNPAAQTYRVFVHKF